MAIKFRKRFQIEISQNITKRIENYFKKIRLSSNVSEHWRWRDDPKLKSFDFSENKIFYTQKENGLDDYYPANFGLGQRLTFLSYFKRILFRYFQRLDPLSLDSIINYRLNEFNRGPITIESIKGLDQNNPNWCSVRAILISNMLLPYIKKNSIIPKIILEIGPGSGNLLYCMKLLYENATCVIVDLPSSILFSAVNILSKMPEKNFILPNEISKKTNFSDYDFVFLRDDQIKLLQNEKVDVFLNTLSFAEMSKFIIKKYFRIMREITNKNNIFYCLNRVEKEMIVNNKIEMLRFHEYPWNIKDKNIFYRMSKIENPHTTATSCFEKLVKLSK